MVGIPFNGDQFTNVAQAGQKHIGVSLDWHGMTEESLAGAVHEVLNDPSYKAGVAELSSLIMDQPQHPLHRVIWWMEYLLRHPHNTGMTAPAHHLWWFQYFLLDVAAVILLACLSMVYVSRALYRYCAQSKIKKD